MPSLGLITGGKNRIGWQLAVLLGVIAAGGVCLFEFNPTASNLYPPCPFFALSGYYCPGCGTLRGLHRLFHGDLAGALGMNPLMVLSLPFLVYALGSFMSQAVLNRPWPKFFIPASFIWGLLGLILVYWFLRNLPYYPFNLLAPG
ncbi:MAG: DUF2752 domain-containing protein [Pseudomonadota bacterium]